jgi:hypothetical protein
MKCYTTRRSTGIHINGPKLDGPICKELEQTVHLGKRLDLVQAQGREKKVHIANCTSKDLEMVPVIWQQKAERDLGLGLRVTLWLAGQLSLSTSRCVRPMIVRSVIGGTSTTCFICSAFPSLFSFYRCRFLKFIQRPLNVFLPYPQEVLSVSDRLSLRCPYPSGHRQLVICAPYSVH